MRRIHPVMPNGQSGVTLYNLQVSVALQFLHFFGLWSFLKPCLTDKHQIIAHGCRKISCVFDRLVQFQRGGGAEPPHFAVVIIRSQNDHTDRLVQKIIDLGGAIWKSRKETHVRFCTILLQCPLLCGFSFGLKRCSGSTFLPASAKTSKTVFFDSLNKPAGLCPARSTCPVFDHRRR